MNTTPDPAWSALSDELTRLDGTFVAGSEVLRRPPRGFWSVVPLPTAADPGRHLIAVGGTATRALLAGLAWGLFRDGEARPVQVGRTDARGHCWVHRLRSGVNYRVRYVALARRAEDVPLLECVGDPLAAVALREAGRSAEEPVRADAAAAAGRIAPTRLDYLPAKFGWGTLAPTPDDPRALRFTVAEGKLDGPDLFRLQIVDDGGAPVVEQLVGAEAVVPNPFADVADGKLRVRCHPLLAESLRLKDAELLAESLRRAVGPGRGPVVRAMHWVRTAFADVLPLSRSSNTATAVLPIADASLDAAVDRAAELVRGGLGNREPDHREFADLVAATVVGLAELDTTDRLRLYEAIVRWREKWLAHRARGGAGTTLVAGESTTAEALSPQDVLARVERLKQLEAILSADDPGVRAFRLAEYAGRTDDEIADWLGYSRDEAKRFREATAVEV